MNEQMEREMNGQMNCWMAGTTNENLNCLPAEGGDNNYFSSCLAQHTWTQPQGPEHCSLHNLLIN